MKQKMKAVSHRWVFVLTLLLGTLPSYANLNICGHLDDSIDEEVLQTLNFYKPDVFKSDCQSNIVVEQSSKDKDVIQIRGDKYDLPDRMVLKNDQNKDSVIILPFNFIEKTLNNVCQDFLGCEYDYKQSSLSYDLLTMVPEKKMDQDGEVCEDINYPYEVFEWNVGKSSKKIFVNRYILKGLQCKRDRGRKCDNEIPPLFEKISEENLKVAFVLDISGSILDKNCFGMPCDEYMVQAFHSQLKSMPSTTMVNLYLYIDGSASTYDTYNGLRIYNQPVSLLQMTQKFQTMANKDDVIHPDSKANGFNNLNTHLFYLDDMFDRNYDRVYLFSDFIDYKRPGHNKIDWEVMSPVDIAKRKQAPWKLIVRSFGHLDSNSYDFFNEFAPDVNLGHVPEQK